jgi:hypothetical protein
MFTNKQDAALFWKRRSLSDWMRAGKVLALIKRLIYARKKGCA